MSATASSWISPNGVRHAVRNGRCLSCGRRHLDWVQRNGYRVAFDPVSGAEDDEDD